MGDYKEEKIDEVVRNVWGSWDGLKDATERLISVTEKNNGEKPGSRMFNKELMGGGDMNRDEFKLASQAIHMAIGRLKKEKTEKRESVPKWVSQSAERQQMREHDKSRIDSRISKEQARKNEELLRETHPHFKIK